MYSAKPTCLVDPMVLTNALNHGHSLALHNVYHSPTSLLVLGDILLSEKGTTQGDPLGMVL